MPAMTVKKLIKELKEFDPKAVIVLSKDGEGNGFSPMPDDSFHSTGTYYPETTWSGEFKDDSWKEEEDYDPEDYEDRKGQRCVVLWPTN